MWKRISLFIIIILTTISCADNKTASGPSLGDHFPQKINTPNTYMEMLVEGKLVLDNGCLRINEVGVNGLSIMLIWDSRFSTRTEQGVVQIVDSNTGEVLATVGDFVEAGGGSAGTNPDIMGLKKPIPDECPGPYFLVGETIKKIDKP